MVKHEYTVSSEEGAERYGAELDTTVELDLSDEEELAVVAAGWLEPVDKKTTTSKAKEAKS